MLILGIDPGSIKTGWALLSTQGRKISYVDSGVLSFNSKTPFLERLTEIKIEVRELLKNHCPDEIALESLIYVKSPTALIKLAQTRGMILSEMVESHQYKIFEYSPNLVKSSAVGHGHADKQSVQKFVQTILGNINFKTHDESDAVAIAICHILNKDTVQTKASNKRSKSGSLASAVEHRIKEMR